jgi:hypothetical protein
MHTRRRFLRLTTLSAGLILFIGGGYLGVQALFAPEAAPSCTWHGVHFVGGTSSQRGAIGCYLRALATRSSGDMTKVMPNGGQGDDATVLPSAFRFSKSASAGPVTVTVKPNAVDSADVEAHFAFADGQNDAHELHIADPMSQTDWRFSDVDEHDD